MVSIELIKKLRELTGAGVSDCREALKESGGILDRAQEILRQKGIEKAGKRSGRETKAGLVDTYVHAGGELGSLVSVACETDFVARTPEFKNLVHEIAMQVASMEPRSVEELLEQEYIRDPKMTVAELIKQAIARLGENIKVVEFKRFTV